MPYGRINIGTPRNPIYIKIPNIYMYADISEAEKLAELYEIFYITGNREGAASVIVTKSTYGYDMYYSQYRLKTLEKKIKKFYTPKLK